jgi:phosphatidylglycerophosphatase A
VFRVLDILKPWPISIADKKLAGGFGIMFDDILAGAIALIIMHLVF